MSMSHQHSDACCRYRLPIGQRVTANPNIEAAAKAGYEYVHGGDRWEDAEPLDRERFIGEARVIVAAALTPQEDTE